MVQAEQIYGRQGTRRKSVYIILAACNKLAGMEREAESACAIAKQIETDTSLDRRIEIELGTICK